MQKFLRGYPLQYTKFIYLYIFTQKHEKGPEIMDFSSLIVKLIYTYKS